MSKALEKIIILGLYTYITVRACLAFQQIASRTDPNRWGGSLSWGVAFAFLILFCIAIFVILIFALWKPETLKSYAQKIIQLRERLGIIKWILSGILFIFPVWLLQYTVWGLVFHDIYLRLLLWMFTGIGIVIITSSGNKLLEWDKLILTVLFTSSAFFIAQAFLRVTDYPFSLAWSEGNRMWDYSMMFGRELYDYPPDQPVFVLLDIGRQFIGGIPFLFPNVTIEAERVWVGFTLFAPYLLLGFSLFRFFYKKSILWLVGALWTLLFLKQASMHPPLLVSAAVVALLWKSPLWVAIPLIAITGYLTEESRFTWLFAPGMWIGMLELANTETQKISRQTWARAISIGLAGIAGGYFGDKFVGILTGNAEATVAVSVGSVTSSIQSQPLLWYRLLPNATYGIGIIGGLLIAVLPLIIVLFYLISIKKLKFNLWQSLAIIGCLTAFLIVGLIVSTKIGGGGSLHNLDMFMIGLLFVSAIAWYRLQHESLKNFIDAPLLTRVFFMLMFIIPGLQPLSSLRTYEYTGNPNWLFTLTDTKSIKDLDLLPSPQITQESLRVIQQEVDLAKQNGEVLFIDQRQLLTFGYITDVPFVPEYEKKILMNEALSSSVSYFQPFYEDLAERRFSLIISEPLRTPIKDSTFGFGEENNAWVEWVSNPVLCYYEEKILLEEVGVQLLIPKTEPLNCTTQLPKDFPLEP